MFIHMNLLLNGYPSIYLGQSIPLDSLLDFHPLYEKVTYISYFTINPSAEDVNDYLNQINFTVLRKESDELLILGKRIQENGEVNLPLIKQFDSIQSLLDSL